MYTKSVEKLKQVQEKSVEKLKEAQGKSVEKLKQVQEKSVEKFKQVQEQVKSKLTQDTASQAATPTVSSASQAPTCPEVPTTGDALYYEQEVSVSQTWMMSEVQKQYHHLEWKKKFKLSSKKTLGKTLKAVCCGNCTLYKTALNARKRALGGDLTKYKCYQVLLEP
jgi:hypothetical protein